MALLHFNQALKDFDKKVFNSSLPEKSVAVVCEDKCFTQVSLAPKDILQLIFLKDLQGQEEV